MRGKGGASFVKRKAEKAVGSYQIQQCLATGCRPLQAERFFVVL